MSSVSRESSGAPRVLLDATAVPADRGGVGRYVDGLIGALAASGQDLVVVCQRSDAQRYERMAPDVEVVAGPSAISHRPARLAGQHPQLTGLIEPAASSFHFAKPLKRALDRSVRIGLNRRRRRRLNDLDGHDRAHNRDRANERPVHRALDRA